MHVWDRVWAEAQTWKENYEMKGKGLRRVTWKWDSRERRQSGDKGVGERYGWMNMTNDTYFLF